MARTTVVRIGTTGIALLALSIIACRQRDDRPIANPARVAGSPSATTGDATEPVWHYEGDEGPAHWGTVSTKFAACASGRAQSPINIVAPARHTTSDAVMLKFPPSSLRIIHHDHVADAINNGHTIQVNYSDGDTLTVGNSAYQLIQYHFHGPSEHTVDGRRFPMEMHLVHAGADGQLAVIGVLIAEGAHNAAFDPIWAHLPATKGVENHLEQVTVDVDALLPIVRTTYRYDGSLTTPPCAEGVQWLVMTNPIELSKTQLSTFAAIFHGNNRPVQLLNGRTVMTDELGGSK
jgi:carbonic anhydrase